MIHVSDLSLADIEFLQAVKSINKNPDKYQETDRTEVAANTASIKRATNLTAEQVSYRMGGNQNSRGFEKGDNPLIKTYDPKPTDRGYAPRAVELTEAGWDILSEAQKVGSRLEGVTQEDIDTLREELNSRIVFLEIKSNIQDYLIMFDYEHFRFDFSNDIIIGITNGDRKSTVVESKTGYEVAKIKDGSVVKRDIMAYDPVKIANQMIKSVTD